MRGARYVLSTIFLPYLISGWGWYRSGLLRTGVPSLSFVYLAGWLDAWRFVIAAPGDSVVDYEAIANDFGCTVCSEKGWQVRKGTCVYHLFAES